MKEIKIKYYNGGFINNTPILNYSKFKLTNNHKITSNNIITIVFNYPYQKEYKFKSNNGFTLHKIIHCIIKQYKKIYCSIISNNDKSEKNVDFVYDFAGLEIRGLYEEDGDYYPDICYYGDSIVDDF
jgi:hypothetical protein